MTRVGFGATIVISKAMLFQTTERSGLRVLYDSASTVIVSCPDVPTSDSLSKPVVSNSVSAAYVPTIALHHLIRLPRSSVFYSCSTVSEHAFVSPYDCGDMHLRILDFGTYLHMN